MLWIGKSVLAFNIKLVETNVVQEHIDSAKIVGCDIDFLPKESICYSIPSKDLYSLQKQGTRATSRIYKDAVFDTNEYPGHRRAEAGNIKKSRAFAVPPVIPAEL